MLLLVSSDYALEASDSPSDVLFIAVDGLNDWSGCPDDRPSKNVGLADGHALQWVLECVVKS